MQRWQLEKEALVWICLYTSTQLSQSEILMLPGGDLVPVTPTVPQCTDCETVNGWGVGFKAQEPLQCDLVQPQVSVSNISTDHGVTENKEALL